MGIKDIIKHRILILDGAMGTMIQSYGLTEEDFRGERFTGIGTSVKGNNDMLNITRPDVIEDIHKRYLEAGADIITTNTFCSQTVSQADYGLGGAAAEMALCGARIARRAADMYSTAAHLRFVAGSVGPTNKTCSMSPDVSNPAARELDYDTLFGAYCRQMAALIDGGVDLLLIETIFDTLNSKAAIDAAMTVMVEKGKDIPIMLSVTVSDLAGRTFSGQTLEAFLASVSTYPIFSIGLNCSFGAAQMKPYIEELAARAPYYISVCPNAGLPDEVGNYGDTPDVMAGHMAGLVAGNFVNIIGGCCGTTDEFIRRLVTVADGKNPHIPAEVSRTLWLSGLELLDVTQEVGFVNVGERCNVAGSRRFLRLINEKKYDEAVAIARKQVADGAQVIDINMDDGLIDAKSEMVNFLNRIATEPDIARVPVMIDSSKWEVIEAGLKCVQGKGIVNSISLKEGEETFIRHAMDVKRYGAAVVVMCFDEQGQATSFERRIEIARRAYGILTEKVGMNPLDIIFDPNILAVATGMDEHDSYASDFIRATGWIRNNLPGVHVSGGVSNLSFSFRGNNYIREAMHAVFLYHAVRAGMDFGIVNPAANTAYCDIPEEHLGIIEDVILNRRKGAADDLIRLAAEITEHRNQETTEVKSRHDLGKEDTPVSEKTVGERISEAVIKGIGDRLDADLAEAVGQYPHAVDIIAGPLMDGINAVGEQFRCGKMFLPQVVKSARTMKQAVDFLHPYIAAEKVKGASTAGKILLATVKGDVHDIGKNIVGVVMACNNYDVTDMGVMVPAGQIVRKAIEEHVDIVGLSGLITPSLEEMVTVVREMQKYGLTIPVMIGGATTSELYVALRVASVYSGPVVWVRDASQNPVVAAKLLDKKERGTFISALNDRYSRLRDEYAGQSSCIESIEEARKNKLNLF
ncbi:methionine synthase [Prevotella sp. PMUR]|uniref:Methionine synthase n=2 Tax=Xylanibacter muris TaxID=2736290 RepID=A0ABX2APE2_9BACT|nr:methionine synthase [Xylanibacter muris]NPD93005.1 methionine synthase [Xylanibacter muris]